MSAGRMKPRFVRRDWLHAFAGLRRDGEACGLSSAETDRLVRDAEVMIRECIAVGVPADRVEVVVVSERAGHARLMVGDGTGCVTARMVRRPGEALH